MPYIGNTSQSWSNEDGTIRESLDDFLTIVSSVETPLLGLFEHVPLNQKFYEWGLDTITRASNPTTVRTSTSVEGSDAVFSTPSYPARVKSIAQINAEALDVTATERASIMAGRTDEFRYRAWKLMTEMATKIELAIHFGVAQVGTATTPNVANTGNEARVTHGLITAAVQSGVDRFAIATNPLTEFYSAGNEISTASYASTLMPTNLVAGPPVSATDTILTRTLFNKSFLGGAHDNEFRVDGSLILVAPQLRRSISSFCIPSSSGAFSNQVTGNVPANYRNVDASLRQMFDTIDVITTDMGTVYIANDRYLNTSTTYNVPYGVASTSTASGNFVVNPQKCMIALHPSLMKIGVLRGMGFRPLAITGDSTKGQYVMEWGFKPLSLKAMTVACGLTENSGY